MTNSNAQSSGPASHSCPVHIIGLGAALSAALIGIFVICWFAAVAFPSIQLAHGWIALFSVAPADSTHALVDGVVASFGFAWISALIFGTVYNAFH